MPVAITTIQRLLIIHISSGDITASRYLPALVARNNSLPCTDNYKNIQVPGTSHAGDLGAE